MGRWSEGMAGWLAGWSRSVGGLIVDWVEVEELVDMFNRTAPLRGIDSRLTRSLALPLRMTMGRTELSFAGLGRSFRQLGVLVLRQTVW